MCTSEPEFSPGVLHCWQPLTPRPSVREGKSLTGVGTIPHAIHTVAPTPAQALVSQQLGQFFAASSQPIPYFFDPNGAI